MRQDITRLTEGYKISLFALLDSRLNPHRFAAEQKLRGHVELPEMRENPDVIRIMREAKMMIHSEK